MENDELKMLSIGDKIEIIRLNVKDKKNYPSQILDISDNDIILISGPIYKNKLMFLHNDEMIRIIYVLENRGKYAFDAEILNINLSEVYKLKIRRISEVKKIQLRSFYRFEISIPVTKYFLYKYNKEEKTIAEKCETKDISGNGLRISTNYKHNIGDVIICEFYIDDYLINTKARIIRIEDLDSFSYKYSIGIQFIDLDEVEKDKIVKFIFSKQRVLREKGLI